MSAAGSRAGTHEPCRRPPRADSRPSSARPQAGQTSITLESVDAAPRARSRRPEGSSWDRAWCASSPCSGARDHAPFSVSTRSTLPVLPASLPLTTLTWSPLRIFSLLIVQRSLVSAAPQRLPGERDDLHEVLLAELAGHRPEDAGAARVVLVVDEHRRVLVERDVGAVLAPNSFLVRTTTARTTSPFLTLPPGVADFTVATMMSPTWRSAAGSRRGCGYRGSRARPCCRQLVVSTQPGSCVSSAGSLT